MLISSILLFLALAISSSLTTRPESDEGSFASPAQNLVNEGHFGTTVFELEKKGLTRMDQRTYWVMPLFLLNVSLAFKVLGIGLFSMRLVSIGWGIVLLMSWFLIVLKLSQNRAAAVFCTLFLSCSYVILSTATIGRGDTMCASAGFAAFASYLWLRERNLLVAILISQTLVVISGMTHFLGILPFFGLAFLTIYFDFRSIKWKHLAIGILPYAISGTAFGIWILQDLEAFRDQFIDNAAAGGRMSGFGSPLLSLWREFTYRYPRAFGLLENTAGHSGPIYLKSLILVGYLTGIVGILVVKELRQKYKILIILAAIYFIGMTLLDGQKLSVYLIYIVPFYTVFLAIWTVSVWENKRIPRFLIGVGTTGLLLLGIGGIALRTKQNTYGYYYLPAIEFVNQNAKPGELIMGGPETRFALNPDLTHIADGAFGYDTGKRPKYIIYDPGTDDSWKDSKEHFPEFYAYFPKLLTEEYRIAYENAAYRVYVKR